MFGYFRPFESDLTSQQEKVFKSYYCRICYCLRSLGNQLCRYLTTFDAAIYSIIYKIATGGERPPFFACQKIKKSNTRYFAHDVDGLLFANLTLVGFGEKIADDLSDHDGGKAKAKLMKSLFGKPIEKAQKVLSSCAKNTHDCTTEIDRLQSQNADLMTLLDVYGDLTPKNIAELAPISPQIAEVYRQLSRWVYFVDILSDYDKDYKSGAYNPLKQLDCPTIQSYFDKHYRDLLQANRQISDALVAALLAIRDDSTEWIVLYKVITHSLDTVVPTVLCGGDVSFHYFKELRKNIKSERRKMKEKKDDK